ncbi:LOW QUALITY PROTEIN: hypothetical protein CVT26_002659 [Gymnopilus dilepis]|uniref:Uncharacterized protein n=1 Tax=Gymnopilus dilepis TaxID=231916 RepID=A0A409VF00_9AGAR|nr:LOW QUALITY PROTEIN: hypothetical protein CVT26_002659 [Gymnopilus dilepis]
MHPGQANTSAPPLRSDGRNGSRDRKCGLTGEQVEKYGLMLNCTQVVPSAQTLRLGKGDGEIQRRQREEEKEKGSISQHLLARKVIYTVGPVQPIPPPQNNSISIVNNPKGRRKEMLTLMPLLHLACDLERERKDGENNNSRYEMERELFQHHRDGKFEPFKLQRLRS